ncbi:MAG TPA: hypothetical protein VGM44_25240 [Polyangiaceae bacterium]|jgi:hypothetical protein
MRALAILCLVVAGCAPQIVDAPPEGEPICTEATFEAGADRSICPNSGANPIVTECDRPASAAQLVRWVGVDSVCSAGTAPNTFCCVAK